jgi:hypothetical protein
MATGPHYVASSQTAQKTQLSTVLLLGDITIRMDHTENAVPLLHVQLLQ